ncbi:MAG: hypothetical protein PVH37_00100 [Desulfobacterales bacterium]|jgi:ADP-ribosylglycohydrolase
MIGAIAGDIIGSVYEHHPIKTKDFALFHPQCYFTDDTVLTLACITGGIAEAYFGPVASLIRNRVQAYLTEDLWQITQQIYRRYRT